jgi:hypothetical protein
MNDMGVLADGGSTDLGRFMTHSLGGWHHGTTRDEANRAWFDRYSGGAPSSR